MEERPRSHGIAGAVLEKSGAPAAGVAVSLKPRRIFSGSPSSTSALTATTDGSGAFAFGSVADGEYEIRSVKNERYESAVALVRAGTNSAVLVVEAVSDHAIQIHGVVQNSGGSPLGGVRIDVIGQPALATSTDGSGAYAVRLPAGARAEQTALRFRGAGYRERRWTMSDGQRPSDYEVIGNVRLEAIAAGTTVSGVVMSTDGKPIAGARVQLDSAALGRGYRATTDRAGAFTMSNVDAATDYRLWARAQSGFKDGVRDNVVVDAAAAPLNIELKPIGTATLRARMVTPNGAAVPAFTLWLTPAYGGAARSTAVTSDAQGRFVVSDLPEGPVALQTRSAPSLSIAGIDVSPSASAEVPVVVDIGPHRLDGRLLTSEGTPAAGARVLLEWSRAAGTVTSRSSRETITDADGAFAFTELGAGTHTVSASLPGTGSVRVEQLVDAGQPPLRITLPGKRGTR